MSTSPNDTYPKTPRELMARFVHCVTERDLERLTTLYESSAVFVPAPGIVHTGLSSIREALAGMLALAPVMETQVTEVHEAGEIALVIVDWTMQGRAPDGSEVKQGGRSADVLRRQADGTWRVLIDHP